MFSIVHIVTFTKEHNHDCSENVIVAVLDTLTKAEEFCKMHLSLDENKGKEFLISSWQLK